MRKQQEVGADNKEIRVIHCMGVKYSFYNVIPPYHASYKDVHVEFMHLILWCFCACGQSIINGGRYSISII